jgi:hypothetical protein
MMTMISHNRTLKYHLMTVLAHLWRPESDRTSPWPANWATNQLRGARTRRFITVFKRALHRPRAKWIHSTVPKDNLPKIHCDPILPSTPWSSMWSLSFLLSHKNFVHSPLPCSAIRNCFFCETKPWTKFSKPEVTSKPLVNHKTFPYHYSI